MVTGGDDRAGIYLHVDLCVFSKDEPARDEEEARHTKEHSEHFISITTFE